METNDTTIFTRTSDNQEKKTSRPMWQQVTIGGVSGIMLVGGVAAAMQSSDVDAATLDADVTDATTTDGADGTTTEGTDNNAANGTDGNSTTGTTATGTDGNTPTGANSSSDSSATSATTTTGHVAMGSTATAHTAANGLAVADVDDSMSFGEAFASARYAVGPGGVFHWRGGIYNTYSSSEWAQMSAADRAAFADRVSPEIRPGEGDPAHYRTHRTDDHAHRPHHEDDDHDNPGGGVRPVKNDEEEEGPQVRFLGVDQMEDSEGHTINVGLMTVNSEEVVYVDADNDRVFDARIHDDNHDGKFQREEVVDISDQHVTVEDFQTLSELDAIVHGDEDGMNQTANVSQDDIAPGTPDYANDQPIEV